MKKVLLSLALLGGLGISSNVHAQCDIGIPNITNAITTQSADSCFVTFDLSFAMKNNNGNKTIGIDFWQSSNYVSPAYAKVPSPTELANSLGSLAINNDFSGSPIPVTFLSSYPSGSSVHILQHGAGERTYKAAVDSFYFNLTDIKIGVKKNGDGSCPLSLLTVLGNVWSTNSGSADGNSKVHCVSAISFSLGNPTIPSAIKVCDPSVLRFRIETTSTTDITVSYKIFRDDNVLVGGDRVFNSATDVDVTLPGTMPITDLRADNPYLSGDLNYGSDPNYSGSAYWVVVYYTPPSSPTYSVSSVMYQACSTLPVTFSSFNASRKNSQSVALTWETSFEQNNKGFYVQRNSNGEWKNVAFVFSSADGGNSSQTLRYAYNDPNNLNSISYYRIQQVDIDGRARYSDVRAVKGEEQASKIMLFPNPGTGGKVNVLFNDETAAKDVMVYDATGRVVKSFKSVSGNSLSINGLKPGMYSLQVKDAASATTASDKFIIQN